MRSALDRGLAISSSVALRQRDDARRGDQQTADPDRRRRRRRRIGIALAAAQPNTVTLGGGQPPVSAAIPTQPAPPEHRALCLFRDNIVLPRRTHPPTGDPPRPAGTTQRVHT
jgi:hypothetical protein